MVLELRRRQQEAIEAAQVRWLQGLRRMLIQLPTGVGKTPVLAMIRRVFGFKKKIALIVHRDKLAHQAKRTILEWNPDEKVGIEMGDLRADNDCTFVIMSAQTLGVEQEDGSFNLRLLGFDPDDFDAVLCDEAHHAIASTWRSILNYFGLYSEGNTKLLLGVTATVNRGDEVGLALIFDELVYTFSMLEAIREGWLCPPVAYRVDVDDVPTAADAVAAYQKLATGRKGIFFAESIEHAKHIDAGFNAAGISSIATWSGDPERDEKMSRHYAGEVVMFCNVEIATEGYDDPNISVVMIGRRTDSSLLYEQIIGRGGRLQRGVSNLVDALAEARQDVWKKDFVVVDLVNNSDRHTLISMPSIFGLPPNMNLNGKVLLDAVDEVAEFESKYPYIDFSSLTDLDHIQTHAESVDLFSKRMPETIQRASTFLWYQTPDGAYILRLPDSHEYLEVFKDLTGRWTAKGSIRNNHFTKGGLDSPEEGIQFCDSLIPIYGMGMIGQLRKKKKVGKPATDFQTGVIRDLCQTREQYENLPKDLTQVEAASLIQRLMMANATRPRK